jgi:multidrug efflux pump subunit AcrB
MRLGDIAQLSVQKADPPESAAIYRGQDAVVLGVSMRPGQNIKAVGAELKQRVSELENSYRQVLNWITSPFSRMSWPLKWGI